jgi:hypothetical protein
MVLKRCAIISLTLILGLGICATAHALPISYTLKGRISAIELGYDRRSGTYNLGNLNNLWVGKEIQYEIEIDLSKTGTIVKHGYPTDTRETLGVHARYISGDALPLDRSVWFSYDDIMDHNYMDASGSIRLQSIYNLLKIERKAVNDNEDDRRGRLPESPWTIDENTRFTSENYFYDFGYSSTNIAASIKINDLRVIANTIDPPPPPVSVPDASLMVLLGSALIGFAVYSRRKDKQ